MKSIWILWDENDYYSRELEGVFATKKLAQTRMQELIDSEKERIASRWLATRPDLYSDIDEAREASKNSQYGCDYFIEEFEVLDG